MALKNLNTTFKARCALVFLCPATGLTIQNRVEFSYTKLPFKYVDESNSVLFHFNGKPILPVNPEILLKNERGNTKYICR